MNTHYFLETAEFQEHGGWFTDTQCVEAMGAPYLLAHGIGIPVKDAWTLLEVQEDCELYCHAHTRDWTAVWKRGTPAGRFQLVIDGVAFGTELGTNGTRWDWQFAGKRFFRKGVHRVALHDLTGFDARCDALFFTTDPKETPPPGGPELAAFRRSVRGLRVRDDSAEYDLLVCGGGYAGICAALAGKRKGLRVLLVQDRPVLGGCGSSEIRVWCGGMVRLPPFPALGSIAAAISPVRGSPGMKKDAALFEDDRKRLLFDPGECLTEELVIDVEENGSRIESVVTKSVRTGRETRRKAKYFADCSGDAILARKAHCAVMYGREGSREYGESLAPEKADRLVMGHSTLWETRELPYTVDFPDIDWGLEFNEANALRRFNCCWDWETGQTRDQIRDIEYIRDYGLMTCFGNWSFLKNRSKDRAQWRNMALEWISAIGGKRESCRVAGDYILTQNDLEEGKVHPDDTASASWSIDLHLPDVENRKLFGEAFQSCAYHRGYRTPAPVPFRCLYAKDAANLFLGGRCLSATHVAFSCLRVMRTLGMFGEAVGIAAAACVRNHCSPRELVRDHWELLAEDFRAGAGYPVPNSFLEARTTEAYHFMRPEGMYGNPGEDCWIRFDPSGHPYETVPDGLSENIEALSVTHKNGKKWTR